MSGLLEIESRLKGSALFAKKIKHESQLPFYTFSKSKNLDSQTKVDPSLRVPRRSAECDRESGSDSQSNQQGPNYA